MIIKVFFLMALLRSSVFAFLGGFLSFDTLNPLIFAEGKYVVRDRKLIIESVYMRENRDNWGCKQTEERHFIHFFQILTLG
jgi:hypothetical protein